MTGVGATAYAVCFGLGLLLAVYVMLHGVERAPTGGKAPTTRAPHEATLAHDPRTEPRALFNRQNAAAFVLTFGAAGYLLQRSSGWGGWTVAAAAALAGGAALALSAALLRGWALPSARRDVADDRYVMQGHPATVTRAIPAGGVGEIAYEADGRRWTVPARGWDDTAIDAGGDVAIERVEDGVAYVEGWAQVEARL